MTALVVVAADQLPIQLFVERKYSVLEMVAEDVILGNQLHTGMRFAVIEQQTVAVHTVAARPPDQAADLPKLSCFNLLILLNRFFRQSYMIVGYLSRFPSFQIRTVLFSVYNTLPRHPFDLLPHQMRH